MRLSFIALLAGTTTAVAEDMVTLFLPGPDPASVGPEPETNTLNAKVIGTKGSATSYIINCPPKAGYPICEVPEKGYTVLGGPSTMQLTYSETRFDIRQGCDLYATTSAVCWETIIEDGDTASRTTTLDIATVPHRGSQPVHITATQTDFATTDLFAAASTATSTGASSAAATTTPTNAAMPVVTGNTHWAVGGVAAAIALAVV